MLIGALIAAVLALVVVVGLQHVRLTRLMKIMEDGAAQLRALSAHSHDQAEAASRSAKGAAAAARAAEKAIQLSLMLERADVFPVIDQGQLETAKGAAATFALTLFNGGKSVARITGYEASFRDVEPPSQQPYPEHAKAVWRTLPSGQSHTLAKLPVPKELPTPCFLVGRVLYRDVAEVEHVHWFSVRLNAKAGEASPGAPELNRRQLLPT